MGRMFLNALLQHTSSVQPRALNFRRISTRIESHSTDVIGMRVIDMPHELLIRVVGVRTDLNLDLDRFECFKKISSPLVCFSCHKVYICVVCFYR